MIAAAYGLSAQINGNKWLKMGLVLMMAGLVMAACDDGEWERLGC